MGVGGTGGVGGAGPSSAVGGLVGMGVDPGLAAAAVAASNSGPSGPAAGHPGMVGNAAGDHGPAAPSGIGNGHGGISGSPGGTSGGAQAAAGPGGVGSGHHGFGPGGLGAGSPAAGQTGVGGSASGIGGHPGMVGGGGGQHGSGAPGTAFGSSKGDFGGPSIASSSGASSGFGIPGSIGMALADALAGRVSEMANRPGSTHGKNSPSSRGFPVGSEHSMDAPSRVGPKADFGDFSGVPGQRSGFGMRGPGARGRAEAAQSGDPRGQQPAGIRGGVPSDINSRAGLNSADYMGSLPDRTQASLGGWPAGTAANRGKKGDFSGFSSPNRHSPSIPDAGPRGTPAPPGPRHSAGIPSPVGPRHSSGIPSPASQDQGFNMRDDFGPIADTVFGGLRQARDAFSGMEARHGFQQSRPGGVGGGRPRAGNRAQSLGQLLFDRGK